MKRKKTKLVAPALALAIVISAGVYGTSLANGYGRNRDEVQEKLANRFNLNKDEVKKFFEENRQQMQEKRQTEIEKKLQEAVSKGEITEAQKNLILAKKKEMREYMQNNRESLWKLSREDRQNKMQERHEELEKWAKNNNIPEKYLFEYGNGNSRGLGIHRSN